MKTDIQTFTDDDGSIRYTFYETWFNEKISIVIEEKPKEEEWRVVNSVSLPKTIMNVIKVKAQPSTFATNTEDQQTPKKQLTGTTVVDRFDLPKEVRKVLFECDCAEIPLSENQLGYFSDLETLEWFWDIVKQECSQDKEITTSSPEQSITDGECTISARRSETATEEMSDGNVFICESPVTPEMMNLQELECPPTPKKQKMFRRTVFRCDDALDFSQL